jgi:prepilin-type N-terminal cleavage/methylation domain-containing protein
MAMKLMSILRSNRGLTLVELMIVLVLSLMLMAAVFLTYQLQSGSGQSEMRKAAIQQDLRAMMEVITLDIMHAGLDPKITGTIEGIPEDISSRNTLRVVMDLDQSGSTSNAATDAEEVITYSLNGTNLQRTSDNSGVTRIIGNNVSGLTFTYMDKDFQNITPAGNATLNLAVAQSVRFIAVSITVQDDRPDVQTGNAIQRTLTRTICRRNGVDTD